MELILELIGWRISSTEIVSSNISEPLPKKYYNPIERVRKKSEDLDNTEKALVATTDTVVKEVNTDMVDKKRKTKTDVVKKAITPPISAKNEFYTVNKTEKSKTSKKQ